MHLPLLGACRSNTCVLVCSLARKIGSSDFGRHPSYVCRAPEMAASWERSASLIISHVCPHSPAPRLPFVVEVSIPLHSSPLHSSSSSLSPFTYSLCGGRLCPLLFFIFFAPFMIGHICLSDDRPRVVLGDVALRKRRDPSCLVFPSNRCMFETSWEEDGLWRVIGTNIMSMSI